MQPQSGIQRACDKMGGQTALGDALGVTQQAVSLWVQAGFAPPDRVPRIAELTGVPRRELCDPALVHLIQG